MNPPAAARVLSDAWWRYLPRDDDDSDAGAAGQAAELKVEAAAEAEAAAAKDARAQKMPEPPVYGELPTGVLISDLLLDPRVQVALRELVRGVGGEQEWDPASVSPVMVFEPEPFLTEQESGDGSLGSVGV